MKQQRYGNSNVTYAPASLMEAHGSHGENKGYGDREDFIPWDNPDNVLAFETFAAIENILLCYFNPLIFCIGIPANVLNCIVFFRQGCNIFAYLIIAIIISSSRSATLFSCLGLSFDSTLLSPLFILYLFPLLFLSFFCLLAHSPDFFPEQFLLRDGSFGMAAV